MTNLKFPSTGIKRNFFAKYIHVFGWCGVCVGFLGNDDEDGHDEHAAEAQQVEEPPPQAVHQRHRHQRHRHHDGAHPQVGVLNQPEATIRNSQGCESGPFSAGSGSSQSEF